MSTTNTMQPTNTSRSTLIAAFSSKGDADAAVRDLESSGIPANDIRSHAAAGASAVPATVATDTTTHHEGGFTGWLKSVFGQDEQEHNYYQNNVKDGVTIVAVDVAATSVDTVADILNRHNPSNIHEEAPGYGAMSNASTQQAVTANDAQAIPVIEEDLAVGKRSVLRGGVRVYSRMVEEPVEETVRLRNEQVYVNRNPVDRAVTAADLQAGTEQVLEVQEFGEEAVVDKRARVVEEVRVGKNVSERNETIRETLRHTEVDVEPIAQTTQATGAAGSLEDPSFRQHFQQTYGSTGDYDTYGPAYQYGYTSASDPRFANRTFSDVESDLRTDYGRRYPNSTWEKVKDSVRYGWDRVTNKTGSR